MSISLFQDSSAPFAGVASATGATLALILLAEAGSVRVIVSERVMAETERALARKAPAALPFCRSAHRRDPAPEEVWPIWT